MLRKRFAHDEASKQSKMDAGCVGGGLRSATLIAAATEDESCCIMCVEPLLLTRKATLPCCKVPACDPCCQRWFSTCIRSSLHPSCPGGTCGSLSSEFMRKTNLIVEEDRKKFFGMTPPEEPRVQHSNESQLQKLSNKLWLMLHTTPCPTCRVPIQKACGCNHMLCSQCGTHFCFRCGGRRQGEHTCPAWLLTVGVICGGLYFIMFLFGILATFMSFFSAIVSFVHGIVCALVPAAGTGAATHCILQTLRAWYHCRASWLRVVAIGPASPPSMPNRALCFASSRGETSSSHSSPCKSAVFLGGLWAFSLVTQLRAWCTGSPPPWGGRTFLVVGVGAGVVLMAWIAYLRALDAEQRRMTILIDGELYAVVQSRRAVRGWRCEPFFQESWGYSLVPTSSQGAGPSEPQTKTKKRLKGRPWLEEREAQKKKNRSHVLQQRLVREIELWRKQRRFLAAWAAWGAVPCLTLAISCSLYMLL